MNILIADKFPERGIKKIESLGCCITYKQDLKDEALLKELKNNSYEFLIVRSTKVTSKMVESSPLISLIIRAGSGYNNIDVESASRHSIYVANCPGKNSIAVAELAMGLILSVDRRIPDNVIELRKGHWNKKEFSKARGIFGRTLGVIGTGRIGREVIYRAQSFGMRIVAWSRSLTPLVAEELGVEYEKSPEDVAKKSDIVTIHLALTPETKGIIGKNFFNALKDGAYFINTSRAEIVDEKALIKAIEEKGIRAGLDVFSGEPSYKEGSIQDQLALNPGVYGTHHIGASTEQAQEAVADETVRIVENYLKTGKVLNCVNIMERPPSKALLTIHHKNRIGVLASILDIIRDASINVERMENIIFSGGEGACARIELDNILPDKDINKIKNLTKDIYMITQVPLQS
ncbi:MAG: hydroxyacid dehydrogenase [Spirochaetes bacterium]|nr:MAG: hydroxyacid dehydrogenase [Spirochaetota bacterium]